MSVKTAERQVTTLRVVSVYRCDGPMCKIEVDAPKGPVAEVPPGWIFTSTGVAGETKHFHDKTCLFDWMQP